MTLAVLSMNTNHGAISLLIILPPIFELRFQRARDIPWSHNIAILEKVKDPEQRIWYIEKTAKNGWSHSVLIHQIESGLYQRQTIANKVTNFEHRLPFPQSELAVETMKDPYVFDFIPFHNTTVS